MTNEREEKKEKKGIFYNIYFVLFLFSISLLDTIRMALNQDYRILNIFFVIASAYLMYKIISEKRNNKINSFENIIK